MTIEDARRILEERFGFSQFRSGQEAVIECLLGGRSAAAVFPTGGGKSLCYQLPALLLPGVTLVVSPLIALMKDQIDALAARGVEARRLDSSLTADEYGRVMSEVRSGAAKILYVAPERFHNERFRDAIGQMRISLFAVDEAHCISEWGHNFRPDYLKLARIARELKAERILALTATATEKVLADVCREFAIEPDASVRTGFHRENLTLLTTAVEDGRRVDLLLQRLRSRPRGATIVYVTLQRTAEELAARLSGEGFPARAYHAGLGDERRAAVQEWFMTPRPSDAAEADAPIVVATIAFGMGVDKADIRAVYHLDPPKSLESYSQEIGRAGRDGKPSVCELLVSGASWNVLEGFVYGDTPEPDAVRSLVHDVLAPERGDPIKVSQYELSSEHDVRMLVVKTLLTYLELDGHLEAGTPYFETFKFRALTDSEDELFAAFDEDRAAFLRGVFAASKRGRSWLTIDVEEVATSLGEDRRRILRAFDYLEGKGMLEVKPQGIRHRYHRRGDPGDLDELARSLHARLRRRESSEIARLEQVRELVAMEGCRTSALGAHFGEPLEDPCDRCTHCLADERPVGDGMLEAQRILARPSPAIDENLWERARELRDAHRDVLGSARALTRLLCGVTSPKLTRARITREGEGKALFGALSHVPFADVLAHADGRAVAHGG